ncbi:hypothetical protein Tco_0268589 [Tanacetum coccineum]
MEPNKALVKDSEAEDVDVHLYRSMIGSLMYLTTSRPNIMFAVCACARFQVTPKISHLHAVKRIFRYLKGQPNMGLWYPKDSLFDLEAYSDSDYAGASLDRKSTTRGCQFLGKRLISWQCKKQTIVANLTTEAKYVTAENCCRQVLWIQNQMLDYGFNFMKTKIYIDNESTICIVKNLVFHSKTKHIEIRHHFIRDSYEKRLIEVLKINTDHNVADLLTKGFDGNPELELKERRIFDSGCSRHMTGNKSYLTDFEEIDGGELLPFCSNSENIVPKRGLTCLYAKATSDEAILWHTRTNGSAVPKRYQDAGKIKKGKVLEQSNSTTIMAINPQHSFSTKAFPVDKIDQEGLKDQQGDQGRRISKQEVDQKEE